MSESGEAEQMNEVTRVRRLWPEPGTVELDALREHYRRHWETADRGAAALMISSLDGSSELHGLSGGLSSPVDQKLMDVLRSVADVVVVGAGTLRAESYDGLRVSEESVRWRRAHGLSDHPVLAVVSGSLNVETQAPFLANAPVRPLVFTTSSDPRADGGHQARMTALGEVAEIVVVNSRRDGVQAAGASRTVDPVEVHRVLAGRGLNRVLCEGGPSLLGTWFQAECVAQFHVSVAPVVAGGLGPRVLQEPGGAARRTELLQVLQDQSMLILHHEVLPR